MKKKRKSFLKLGPRVTAIERVGVGENIPKIKPFLKEKRAKKPLKKLYRAIKVFVKALAKKKSDLSKLNKVPISDIKIRFDYPDIVKFKDRKRKKKKFKKKDRLFKSGNIHIEDNQVLGAYVYDVVVNPRGSLGKELVLKEEEDGKKKRKKKKSKKDGEETELREKRSKKNKRGKRTREKE